MTERSSDRSEPLGPPRYPSPALLTSSSSASGPDGPASSAGSTPESDVPARSGEGKAEGRSFDAVEVDHEGERKIRNHAVSTYPEEACGILFGPAPLPGQRVRVITMVMPVPNRRGEDRGHRFLIPAEEVRAAERSIAGTGLEILGYYHSHPDHPAEPSAFDQDHAWPWLAYLVLRTTDGAAHELRAFELDAEQRVFQLRELRVVPVTWVTGARHPTIPPPGHETGRS